MRRRKLIVVLAGLAVLVAVGVVVLWPQSQPSSRITRENFDRIKDGMSRAEVEAILGPPGDYRTRLGEDHIPDNPEGMNWQPDPDEYEPWMTTWHDTGGAENTRRLECAWWIGDDVALVVYVDDAGRVRIAGADDRRSAGTLENFLWRAKLQWRRWFPE